MKNHDQMFSKPTQIFWTCQALMAGREISHKTEIEEVRGWRLAAICHRLRREYDWPILSMTSAPDYVARYRLDPTCDQTKLRLPPSAQRLRDGGEVVR